MGKYRTLVSFSITASPTLHRSRTVWTLGNPTFRSVVSTSVGRCLAGRQVLLFGDERVIGPSNWPTSAALLMSRGRHHHPGTKWQSRLRRTRQHTFYTARSGNNSTIYSSFKNIVPRATFEPYFSGVLRGELWSPETVGRPPQ